MATVHDVAAYILERRGQMSAMKLQKLVYYSQAWNLVWDDKPLFPERVEAWANGPVVRDLYDAHRGRFTVRTWRAGEASRLTPEERATVDAVVDFYGDKSAHWLSELSHREPPWRDARGQLSPGERGHRQITPAAMAEYYSSLVADGD